MINSTERSDILVFNCYLCHVRFLLTCYVCSTKIGEISDISKCFENFVSQTLGVLTRIYAAELRLKKSDNDIIQFAYLREDIWLVDIPVMAERGSYMKECEYQDCVDIIRNYYTDSWRIPSQFTLRNGNDLRQISSCTITRR